MIKVPDAAIIKENLIVNFKGNHMVPLLSLRYILLFCLSFSSFAVVAGNEVVTRQHRIDKIKQLLKVKES
jgi:hypothetical protein